MTFELPSLYTTVYGDTPPVIATDTLDAVPTQIGEVPAVIVAAVGPLFTVTTAVPLGVVAAQPLASVTDTNV